MKNRASKYTFIIVIVLIIFNLIFGYVLSKVAARDIKAQIEARMLDISNTAAAMVDGDALEKITKDDYDSPEYQKVLKTLTYFQENIELEYIYCIMQVGEKEFVFGVDAAVEDPGEFGSPVVFTDALYNASKGKADVDNEPYEDAWGTFYSAYSPVYDSAGNVAGIVAVDFDAEWYRGEVRNMYIIVGSFLMVALVFSVVLAIAIASQYKRFFLGLMDKMNNLSEGIDTLIREFDNGFDNEDYYSLVQIDRDSTTDGMDLLGEKIRVMQLRLKEQIEVVRSHAYLDGLTRLQNRTAYTEYLRYWRKRF
jgi:sensor histidine kinase regulating citrate/malate metabolism